MTDVLDLTPTVELEKLDDVSCNASVSFSADDVKTLFNQIYRRLGAQVRLKGFRPGKVPRKVLQQLPRYRNIVNNEVREGLHQQGLQTLIKRDDLEVLALANVEDGELKSNDTYTFTAKLEVRPELDLGDLSSITVAVEKVVAEDSDVDAQIEERREQMATLASVEGRGAEEGDQLVVDYEHGLDEEDMHGHEGTMVWLGKGRFPKEAEDALVGAKEGDTIEVTVKEANDTEDGGEEESEDGGEGMLYRFDVKSVSSRTLPEVDDAFAKKAEFEDLADMRAKLKAELEEKEEEISKQRAREQLFDALIERVEIPVPPNYLEQQIDRELEQMMQWSRLPPQMMQSPEIRNIFRDKAEKDVKQGLIVQQFMKNAEIEITDEDVNEEIGKIAKERDQSRAYLRSQLKEEQLDNLRQNLKVQRAHEQLMESVTQSEEELSKSARDARIEEEQEAERKKQEEERQKKAEEMAAEGRAEAEAEAAAAEEGTDKEAGDE